MGEKEGLWCLRCPKEKLEKLSSPSNEITFFECKKCKRNYTKRHGKDLHDRWLSAISLILYPIIFSKDPVTDSKRVANRFIQGSYKRTLLKRITEEIELELSKPTQNVKDILTLKYSTSERVVREYLKKVSIYFKNYIKKNENIIKAELFINNQEVDKLITLMREEKDHYNLNYIVYAWYESMHQPKDSKRTPSPNIIIGITGNRTKILGIPLFGEVERDGTKVPAKKFNVSKSNEGFYNISGTLLFAIGPDGEIWISNEKNKSQFDNIGFIAIGKKRDIKTFRKKILKNEIKFEAISNHCTIWDSRFKHLRELLQKIEEHGKQKDVKKEILETQSTELDLIITQIIDNMPHKLDMPFCRAYEKALDPILNEYIELNKTAVN